MNLRNRLLGAALALAALAPQAVHAADELPSYAVRDETVKGSVATFDGKYGMTVRDERGFLDTVRLHDGTIINPRGLRLTSGMSVTILGRTSGAAFEATEIDTPYHSSGYSDSYRSRPYVYAPVAPYPYYGAPFYGGIGYAPYGYGFGYGVYAPFAYGAYGYRGYYGRGGYGGYGYRGYQSSANSGSRYVPGYSRGSAPYIRH